ncbi:MAG: SLBB domain-containing protein [Pseudomonadota bacterium]
MPIRKWRLKHIVNVVCFISLISEMSLAIPLVQAQAIPPNVLQELQRQSGSTGARQRRVSPVDQSRDEQSSMRAEQDFAQEQQQFDLEVAETEEPSALELDYRMRLGIEDLEQFGYDRLVTSAQRFSADASGRVSGNYVVGVGDEFAVILRGSQQQDYLTQVDSEGRLILDGMSPVPAAGRRLTDIIADVSTKVADTFIGTDVYLSLATLERVTVTVVGEAQAPGSFQLDSQQTVLDALMRAGGIRKTGSLRQVRLVRNGRSDIIDLYGLFRGEAGVDLNIRDGDRVVIPPVGATYAVAGEVLRPGIFELPSGVTGLSARTAMNVAGGSLRPRGYELIVNRLDEAGTESVQPVRASSRLIEGDALVVVRTSARTAGKLSISGHVGAPGIRALATAPTVGELLKRSGGYLNAPYLPFAALLREDPISLTRTYVPVNLLSQGLNGLTMPLRGEDELIVFGAGAVDFLSSNDVRQVVLSREYTSDLTCEPLSEVANLGQELQTDRFAAVLRGAFVLEGDGKAKIANVGALASDVPESNDAQVQRSVTDQQIETLGEEEQAALRERLCPSVFDEHIGLLPFTLEHVATITGAVRKPAVVPVAGEVSLSNLVTVAGGLSFEASLGNVEISSPRMAEGGMQVDRSLFDLTKTPLETIMISRGSAVTVQALANEQEPGTVLLTGEFRQPGVYTIRRGERLSDVIARAGGVTERAYPYGAVFTRSSVRRAQEQAFKRTAREMNAALTTAALKNNVDADALAAARELSRDMESVETLGRVVVEADPRVLEVRRDLDVVMEPGDRLFLPKRPNHILAMGDVLNPGALQFVRGKSVAQYLSETGGIQTSADEKRIFLVYPNGVARPLPRRFWGSSREIVPPGSTIVVPKDTDPLAGLQLTREVTSILSQLALSAASFAVIFSNN